jgi:protocatechuate 3,4-dioxygenase beta subunit
MKNSNTENFTQRVLDAYSHIDNSRTRDLIATLITHLHLFVKETKLTEKEWEFCWDFLARMAEFTSAERNEFLLLADVLGVSQLIEIINHQRSINMVGMALLGPFYRANAPLRKKGECIASIETAGKRVKISGRVIDLSTGSPIPDAILDIWQAATNGLYETQDPKSNRI